MISDKKRPDICIYSSGHCGNWNRVIWFSQNVLKFIERFHNKQKQNIPYVSYKKLPNEAFFNDFWNTFFKFSFSWENCFLKKLKIENTKNKNFDVALKKHVLMKARYYSKLVLNKCLNTNSDLGRGEYSKHCSYSFTLIRKAKQRFFDNINTTDATDNKTFWRTVKPLFTFS